MDPTIVIKAHGVFRRTAAHIPNGTPINTAMASDAKSNPNLRFAISGSISMIDTGRREKLDPAVCPKSPVNKRLRYIPVAGN